MLNKGVYKDINPFVSKVEIIMAKVKNITKKRIIYMLCVLAALVVVMLAKIFWLQFVEGGKWQELAMQQQTKDRIINPKRGTIYDRNMKELAVSASVDTVVADPTIVKDEDAVEDVCKILSSILNLDYEDVKKDVTKNSRYEIIKSKIESEAAQKIRKEIADGNLPGISIVEDSKRYYPYKNFAAHILGYAGSDNQGLSGIELKYDDYLTGESGRIVTAQDVRGVEVSYEYEHYYSSKDGCSLVLTIDEVIQHYVENELETAIIENDAKNGACAIVMDIKTGEILAMATKPDFDPNSYAKITEASALEAIEAAQTDKEKNELVAAARNKMWRNKAVVDTYEPGSTFKILTSAIAIEENLIPDNKTFYCSGSTEVAGTRIRCWKAGGHGMQTFAQAIQNSCNPAFIEMGALVGKDNFFKYVKGFGLTEKTGIDVTGEALGIFFSPTYYGPVENATTSFGQGFQVTPIQLITAVSAVANNGKYVTPHVVKEIIDADGNVIKKAETQEKRQIVSEKTSEKLRKMLEDAVAVGSGKNAYIKGYRVAGKTGTSEKQPRSENKKIASMVAFAPADDPQVAVLVMIDEPEAGQYFGGVIAAPVVGRIMENTLQYLGVEKVLTEEEQSQEIQVVNTVGKTVEEAKKLVVDAGFKYSVEGNGTTILRQTPQSGVRLPEGTLILLHTEDKEPQMVTVPSVQNCSILQANNIIVSSGLNMKVASGGRNSSSAGDTAAFNQEPAAGTVVEKGTVVYVEFRHLDVE